MVLASYTPWLFPVIFTQSFFYLLITLFFYIIKNKKGNRFYFLLGSLTGLTFLGHAAPAVLFAFIFTFVMALEFKKSYKQDKSIEILKKYAIFVFSSFLFALPLIYFVVFVYRLKTLNYAPNTYLGVAFDISHLITENLDLALLLGVIGLFGLRKIRLHTLQRIFCKQLLPGWWRKE